MILDPQIIHHQIANLLVSFPELAEDEDSWSMALASETELDELLTKLIAMIEDSNVLIDGTAIRMEELKARQDRFKRRIEAFRALIFKLMEAAEIKKRELPLGTLSIRAGTPKVIITDPLEVPVTFCRTEVSPDKKKIKEALELGFDVPGAVMSNGEASLSVRVK